MSDLIGGRPSASTGGGRSNGNGSQIPPVTTGSPSGFKRPTEVMRQRNEREARRRAEQEQKDNLERARAENEARMAEEERRKSAERRAAAAGAATQQRGSGEQRASGSTAQRISDQSQVSNRDRRSGDRVASGGDPRTQGQTLQGVGRGGTAVGGGDEAGAARRPRQTQPSARPGQPESSRRPAAQPTEAGPSTGPSQPAESTAVARSSFPHAFERWETLSAHWEGLTSFWIRRLEENSNEINRDPLSQQLSRQVTDLSAAGANLFHAVVELQRLRASSERKFQRWFFETRAEQEKAQEIQAVTQATLERERHERAAVIADAVAKDSERHNFDKQLAEMRRELQISKEEARRAWEELGRREQEERERTASLRDGQPTLVGGVQVVPMMAGVPSRHGSNRAGPSESYAQLPSISRFQEPEAPNNDSDESYQQYFRAQREPADPFVETTQSPRRTPVSRTAPFSNPSIQEHPAFTNSDSPLHAPAVQPASSSAFYQQNQGTALHPEDEYGPQGSEAAFSEEEYEIDSHGQFIRDSRGNKIRYQGPASDNGSEDAAAERQREIENLARYGGTSGGEYGRGTTSTTGRTSAPDPPTVNEPVDYSGQGYGSGAEWVGVPRHHHPTRLSDVMEEDERSRTSASQVSRRD